MTIANEVEPLGAMTVDGIEWATATDYPDRWFCRAPGLGFFTVNLEAREIPYGHNKRGIFRGWYALETGCGVGVNDVGSAEEAMRLIAPRIRERAKDLVARETAHLKQAKAGAKAVGA